jgi:serine/threonine-protein kinase/endoribonuclease IRE1
MAVFVFAVAYLRDDPHLAKYWPDGTACLLPFCKRRGSTGPKGLPHQQQHPQQHRSADVAVGRTSAVAASRLGPGSSGGAAPPGAGAPIVIGTPAAWGARPGALPASPATVAGGWPPALSPPQPPPAAAWQAAPAPAPQAHGANSTAAAQAAGSGGGGAPHGASAQPTAAAGPEGSSTGAPHAGVASSPASRQTPPDGGRVVVGYEVDGGSEPLHWPVFPRRPGQQACDFFTKTGTCKYGHDCCFDHPEQFVVPLTEQQLPYREGQPVCAFYLKTRLCKFGAACKFHHPRLRPIYAGSAAPVATPT